MKKLQEILKYDIDRTIDGVIKADDKTNIRQEVTEYVLTREVSKHLDSLISGYKDSIEAIRRGKPYPYNGVWISGYFGSGKSHLLKMLAYILESEEGKGNEYAELFVPKIEDQMVKANVQKILEVPARSILFNIDQEADAANTGDEAAILYIFEKVFNRHLGYFPYNRNIAEFERHLDDEGNYEAFKKEYKAVTGNVWEEARSKAFGIGRAKMVQALRKSLGMTDEDARALIEQYKQGSSLSVESFVRRVREWMDRQDSSNYRLNFFIDEVGQFVSGKTRLMLNLQTIAETFATVCEGRVWIFVTSQEDLQSVVGDPTAGQVQDYSKINARYHLRISLSSTDVQEVIQKRLLDKTGDGYELLGDFYMKEKESFRTLFRFESGGRQIIFKDKQQFVLSYPFQAYQYDLLQQSLRGLSEHNAFRGQHISQGERSMLEIFQDVSKRLKGSELFTWATFDLMFEGIRQTLNTALIGAVKSASDNVENPFAVRLLKILLMVKYTRTFKATPEHLRVLLIETLEQDLGDLDTKIREALNVLEYQTYIRKNGEVYEFLTNEEKDVEEEIKNTEVDFDMVRKTLSDTAFAGILKLTSTKVRDPELKEDFPFARKVDGELIGKPADLTFHMITQEHPNYDDKQTILNQAMGKKELILYLGADPEFQKNVRLYFQTDIYCRQHHGHDESPQIQRIISEKQSRNEERKRRMKEQLSDLLSGAELYAMSNEIDIKSTDPVFRFTEGFQKLLRQAYPKLQCLGSHHYTESDLRDTLLPDDNSSLFSGDATQMNEAEKEMYAFIQREFGQSQVVSIRRLSDTFSAGQYGWYHWAIIIILARLVAREKVELIQGNNVKSREEIFALLSSNRDFDQVRAKPIDISNASVAELKELYRKMFNKSMDGSSPRECAVEFKTALQEIVENLEGWFHNETHDLPFLEKERPLLDSMKEIRDHEWTYFLNNLDDFKDELVRINENDIQPLQAFMNGPQKDMWKGLNSFYIENKDNLQELVKHDEKRELESLLQQVPYKNNVLKDLKEKTRALEDEIRESVQEKKKAAVEYLRDFDGALEAREEFQGLTPGDRSRVKKPLQDLLHEVENQTQIALIRDKMTNKGPKIYEQALQTMSKIVNPETKEQFAADNEKQVGFPKRVLETEDDVTAYTDAVKKTYLKLIRENKKIIL